MALTCQMTPSILIDWKLRNPSLQSILRTIQSSLIILLLLTITGLYLVFDARNPQAQTGSVEIVIKQGASLSSIAQLLESNGVIQSAASFKTAAHLLKKTRSIYPGSYTIDRNLSNTEALEALAHAKAVEVSVTIPEGLRSDEIIGLLSRRLNLDSLKMSALLTDTTLLRIAGNGFTHLEGTLFPETYRFLEDSNEYEVLEKLVRHFRAQITEDMEQASQKLGLNLQQLITLASLVEKETAREDEREMVSSVYHNRLKKNMLLGADPTLVYMLVRRGEWNGNIQRKHFSIRDPYNSYLYRGLPPGPVANPGLASIQASLNPAQSDFLYFVGKNDGTGAHDFSKTLREHNNKVNRYQRRRNS